MVVLAIACVYRPSSLSATDSQGENNIRCAIIAGNKDDAYIDGDSYTHTHTHAHTPDLYYQEAYFCYTVLICDFSQLFIKRNMRKC